MRTILLIILVILLIGALPTWPYSGGWGYLPGWRTAPVDHSDPRALARVESALLEHDRNGYDAALSCLHLNDRQRKAQPHLVAEINLDVMDSKLLKLHAAEIMDVGRMALHFL